MSLTERVPLYQVMQCKWQLETAAGMSIDGQCGTGSTAVHRHYTFPDDRRTQAEAVQACETYTHASV